MRHKWEECMGPNAGTPRALLDPPYRKCLNCGKIQHRETQYSWMRVTGYLWRPLAGKCIKKSKELI